MNIVPLRISITFATRAI